MSAWFLFAWFLFDDLRVSSWTFGGTLMVVAIVFGLVFYGLRISLAARPLFRDELSA